MRRAWDKMKEERNMVGVGRRRDGGRKEEGEGDEEYAWEICRRR